MSLRCVLALALVGFDIAGASSVKHPTEQSQTSAVRKHHPDAATLSEMTTEMESDRHGKASSNWLVDLASKKLYVDHMAHRLARVTKKAMALEEQKSSSVQNILRSEKPHVPNVDAARKLFSAPISDMPSRLYSAIPAPLQQLSLPQFGNLRGIQLQIARAIVGFLAVLIVMVSMYSTNRFLKARKIQLPSVGKLLRRGAPQAPEKVDAATQYSDSEGRIPLQPKAQAPSVAVPQTQPKVPAAVKAAPKGPPGQVPKAFAKGFAKQGQPMPVAKSRMQAFTGQVTKLLQDLNIVSPPQSLAPKAKAAVSKAKAKVPAKPVAEKPPEAPEASGKAQPKVVAKGRSGVAWKSRDGMSAKAWDGEAAQAQSTKTWSDAEWKEWNAWEAAHVPLYDPWHTVPTPEMLLSVGPTFRVNLTDLLPGPLKSRGLVPAGQGNVALISFWNYIGERRRALVELCIRDTLANKRAFAQHLVANKLTAIAPPTFLSPAQLRSALLPVPPKSAWWKPGMMQPPSMKVAKLPRERVDGLWFLKHGSLDNNLGVMCFHGADALLKYWTYDIPEDERLHYVAQPEVQRPLLGPYVTPGASVPEEALQRKVTIRAYVLVLATGRCFFHREMLLKTHPHAYDNNDPDLMKHVICHVKYDGVSASRATNWQHYEMIWPKIGEMMAHTFKSFDFAVLQDEAINNEDDLYVWEWAAKRVYFFILKILAMIPFIGRFVKAPNPHLEEAESLKYALLGLDVIVDENLRPWCLELNRSPTLNWEPRDPEGSQLKQEVVEDFTQLLVDPILHAAAEAAKDKPAWGAWGRLKEWASWSTGKKKFECHRGFVELPSPKMPAMRASGAVGKKLYTNLLQERTTAAEAAAVASAEKRVDPDDKKEYTLDELRSKYKDAYADFEVEAYFHSECQKVQSQTPEDTCTPDTPKGTKEVEEPGEEASVL